MLVLDKIENMLQELALLPPEKLDLDSVNDLSDVLNTLASIRNGVVDKGIIQDYAGEYEFLAVVQQNILLDLADRTKQANALVDEIQKVRDLMASEAAQNELMDAELEALAGDEMPWSDTRADVDSGLR